LRKNYLKAYAFHGVHAEPYSDKDALGNCRFCLDDTHFSVNYLDGRYRCVKCERRGNLYTFLRDLHEHLSYTTTKGMLRKLSLERNIGAKTLHRFGLVYDDFTNEWILPIKVRKVNEETKEVTTPIVNLKRWVEDNGKRKLFSTPTCKSHLFNNLLPPEEDHETWICEGEWDVLALIDTLEDLPAFSTYRVLGRPGALVFPEDLGTIRGNFNFLGDHDPAGYRGSVVGCKRYQGPTRCYYTARRWNRNCNMLVWNRLPSENGDLDLLPPFLSNGAFPLGFDVRDLCSLGLPPEIVFRYIRENTF